MTLDSLLTRTLSQMRPITGKAEFLPTPCREFWQVGVWLACSQSVLLSFTGQQNTNDEKQPSWMCKFLKQITTVLFKTQRVCTEVLKPHCSVPCKSNKASIYHQTEPSHFLKFLLNWPVPRHWELSASVVHCPIPCTRWPADEEYVPEEKRNTPRWGVNSKTELFQQTIFTCFQNCLVWFRVTWFLFPHPLPILLISKLSFNQLTHCSKRCSWKHFTPKL